MSYHYNGICVRSRLHSALSVLGYRIDIAQIPELVMLKIWWQNASREHIQKIMIDLLLY